MAASANSVNLPENLPEDIWLLRPCELYKEEYSDCKSVSGRFQQYYVYGENQDCSKWKEDYDNCVKFRNTWQVEAAERVVENERQRRESRLTGARGNDVWEYRHKAPTEWNAFGGLEKTELTSQVQESKGTLQKPDTQSRCVIS